MESLTLEIAAAAARMVVEEGLEYGPAKRRAIKQLGLPARTALPDNLAVEVAAQEYIALFCADTQPQELRALRELALVWMQRFADFRPYLAGAVWRGTATRLSDVLIQLFADDPKSAELHLVNHGLRFDVQTVTGIHGKPADMLTVQVPCQALAERVLVQLVVYDYDDLRGALKPDAQGRPLRGDAAALQKLLHDPAP
jgi:hypothetical protein